MYLSGLLESVTINWMIVAKIAITCFNIYSHNSGNIVVRCYYVWLMFWKNKVYIAIINRKKLENYDNNYNNNDGEEQHMKFMKLNYGLKQVLNIDDLHSKECYWSSSERND